MKTFRWQVIILLLVLLAGCAGGAASQTNTTGSAGIQVRDAWIRAVPMGAVASPGGQMTPAAEMGGMPAGGMGNGAAYMLLSNPGTSADRLLRVESDVAKAVELHVSEMKNDVMTMRPVEAIELPAGGQAELKPGGLHIMLIGLTRDLKPGDVVSLTLVFENAGPVNVAVEVKLP